MRPFEQEWVCYNGEKFLIRKLQKGAVAFRNGRYFWRSSKISDVKKACKIVAGKKDNAA
ncbi:hypothetical protein EVC24_017 [Rhizobium phage RHph_I4]|nr:hypothetical protein EVC24_017 [Rhizobium phage RHph_I4]